MGSVRLGVLHTPKLVVGTFVVSSRVLYESNLVVVVLPPIRVVMVDFSLLLVVGASGKTMVVTSCRI
jgi:hypothetical protein